MSEEYVVLGEIMGFQGINTDISPELLPPEDNSYFITGGNNIIIQDTKIKKLRGWNYLNDITTQLGRASFRRMLGMPIYRKYSTGAQYLMAVAPQDHISL